MKLSHGLAAIVLTMSAAAVHADVTGTVMLTSDYDFRGFTQTRQDPAIQGSIDYTHSSGLYAGAWASNVDFGNCCDENVELDLYGGWRGGSTIAWDLGAIYYTYPGAHDINYPEIYAGATWKVTTGKVRYSWHFGNTSRSAEYYQLDASIPLPANFTLGLHSGYSDGDDRGGDNSFDWSARVTYTSATSTSTSSGSTGRTTCRVTMPMSMCQARTHVPSSRSRPPPLGRASDRLIAVLRERAPTPGSLARPGVFSCANAERGAAIRLASDTIPTYIRPALLYWNNERGAS